MKRSITLAALFILMLFLFVRGSLVNRDADRKFVQTPVFEYPAEIKAIIQLKCYGCHSIKGYSKDAREGLMWDSIPKYGKAKQIAKLDDIADVLDQGTMPPKEMVEKYPNTKLTSDELQKLKSWVDETADKLVK
jgi:hypothetical protein